MVNCGVDFKPPILPQQLNPPRKHMVTGYLLPCRDIHNLPFPNFYNAVVEVSKNYGANYDMTMMVALAFIAVCCQGLAKVKKPRGGLTPLSLMILILASPGARKSPLVKAFFCIIKEIQQELMEEYDSKVTEAVRKVDIWNEITKALKAKLRKIARNGGDLSEIEAELSKHLENKPCMPLKPKFIYEDITGPSLWKSMLQSVRSGAVVSSEASAALGKWLLQDLCHFNSANDGEVIDITRAGDGTIQIQVILSFLLMLQPELFDKFLMKRGSDLRDLGIFARFLLCRPESLAGQRFDDGAEQCEHFLRVFRTRGRELMLRSYRVMCGEEDAEEIDFEPDAKRLWIDIYNEIELKQQSDGEFEGMEEHASKLMDIISRVAGCLHFFEGCKGGISTQTLRFAKEICYHSADYYRSQFVHPPQAVKDAIEINENLNRHYRTKNLRFARWSDVRSGVGTLGLRKKDRFDAAIYHLKEQGIVSEWRQKIPGRREIIWLDLRPEKIYYPAYGDGHWYQP